MRAVLCNQFGPPESLVVGDVPHPVPGRGQVLVSVHAAGVNFPDALIVQGKYQNKPELPFTPGSEVAGIVKAVGEDVVDPKPGQRVIAFTSLGGFAEEVLVEAARTLPLPAGMDFITASAFVVTYATSYHALKDRAAIEPGETLLVLGASGGVGLTAIQVGKLMGARVIAAASSEDKLATCQAHGADELINYSTDNLRERIKALTGGRGVDVVYDPVGGDYAEPALRSLAWLGRYLVVGFAAGEIPKIPLNLTLLKGCSIMGVFWGTFVRLQPALSQANLAQLVRWFSEGRLKSHVSGTYPLERAADALNDVLRRKVKGKLVLRVDHRPAHAPEVSR